MFIYISYICVQLYIIQIFVYTFLSISFTNRYKWIHKYMQIEKYIFCTNVCGSICREATLVNLSHSSICNLIVCVHSPQRYCCYFLYRHRHTHRKLIHRHTQRQTHRHTQRHTHRHADTLKYTSINTQNPRSKARSIDFNENYAISSSSSYVVRLQRG